MIQRIQSLYLLIVTALMACTLFMPVAHVTTTEGVLTLQAFKPFGDTMAFAWLFAALFIISTLLPLVTIFLFKHRKRQVGLCAAEGVLQLGCVAVILMFYWVIIPDILPADVSSRSAWAGPLSCLSFRLSPHSWRAVQSSRMRFLCAHSTVFVNS